MLAHAAALLRAGHEVHLVGGTRTPLPYALQRASSLSVHSLDVGEASRGDGPAASLATGVRGIRLGWRMARVLLRDTPPPDLILVQTPPPLPTLPVAMAAARLRGARLLVDWHNLGWTLLALRFGSSHPLVHVMRWAEHFFGRRADGHLAVSALLARRLMTLGLRDVAVLHDGPSAVRPFPPARNDLPDDPLVVVAPMGWTRDDDLPLLADALRQLTRRVDSAPAPRRALRLLVSGDGPLRAEWGPRLRAIGGVAIRVETPDVAVDDYPNLLAGSHLGLCVHRSASGLDLPMKIVELQTVGVPVLALDDGSPLEEIVPPECGVVRYGTASGLAEQLYAALAEDHDGSDFLSGLTAQARRHTPVSWDDRWPGLMQSLLPPVK
ncbi:MAG: glycosyltransferase [Gemmatimonadaceae bacterium]